MARNFRKSRESFFGSMSLNTWLVVVNVICFVVFSVLISLNILSLDMVAIKPANILAGKYLWTFLTSMFMHAGFFHLFVNMISLFFVGSLVERIIGRKRYFWFYMLSGIFAGLVFVMLSHFFGNSEIGARIFVSPSGFAVGASGAIFGLVGLLSVLIPKKKIYLIGGPLIAIIIQAVIEAIIPNSSALGFLNLIVTVYIFFSIFAMFSGNPYMRRASLPIQLSFAWLPVVAIVPLMIIGLFVNLPIGNTAHLGGLISGLVYGFYLKKKYKRKTAYISRYFN